MHQVSMRIVIPYTQRLLSLPNQNFRTLMHACEAHGRAHGVDVVCVDESEIEKLGPFDVLLSIRTLGLQSEAVLQYYRQQRVRIAIWHDDILACVYRTPITFVPRRIRFLLETADLLFLPYHTQGLEHSCYREYAHKCIRMPWSVPDDYCEYGEAPWRERNSAIVLTGAISWQYPLRCAIWRYLQRHTDLGVDILEHPSYNVEQLHHQITGGAFVEHLSKYQYAIATTGHKYTVAKYMEIPAAGCVMLCESTPDLQRLGFIPGQNCRTISSSNFKAILHGEEHPDDEDVARRGHELVKNRHVHSLRAERMLNAILKRHAEGWTTSTSCL